MRNTKKLEPRDIVLIRFITQCSRKEFADRLGFSYVYIAKLETGQKPIVATVECRIREALQLTDAKLDQLRALYKKLEKTGESLL